MFSKQYNRLYVASTLLLLLALLLLIIFEMSWARYILLLGTLGYLLSVVSFRPKKASLRLNRLIRMGHFSGLLWLASAIALLFNSSLWAIFAGVACLFMLYSNIMITFSKEAKKSR